MPELPEAEVTARQLRARVVGKRVAELWVGRADIIREGAHDIGWYPGSMVRSVERRGKSVLLTMEKDREQRYLVAELGMTGLLLFSTAMVKSPQHVHAVLSFDRSPETTLRYWNPRRFGRLSLFDAEGLKTYVGRRFGYDPLSVSEQEFTVLLSRCRRRLKPLLMHQQTIAGIGNIYANEILFRTALHPNTLANRVTSVTARRLYHTMQSVLREAIACGGSSVRDFFAPDGSEGRYKQHHLVYRKEGMLCSNGCGSQIRRLHGERSSFYCPTCQKPRRCP